MPTGAARKPSADSRLASHGPTVHTPAVAPTDSQNPIDRSSNGSTSTSAVTARHSTRNGDRSRPRTYAVVEIAAIVPARTIDGSNLVRLTNQAIRPSVTTQRATGRRRDSTGPAAAITNDTF